eukprot:gene11898-5304_t
MVYFLGDKVPDFEAKTTEGTIKFYDYLGESWGCLFSHPADFTPVCTTELGAVAKIHDQLTKRNVKPIALSVDSVESHLQWIADINETQKTEVKYPIIADEDRKLSEKFGMLDQTNLDKQGLPLTVRSVFIIDSNKTLRLTITYPASCGRNFDEILRVIDSLQLTTNKSLATPYNWKQGDDVIIAPNIKDEEAKEKFGEFTKVKPYLRYTKCPK